MRASLAQQGKSWQVSLCHPTRLPTTGRSTFQEHHVPLNTCTRQLQASPEAAEQEATGSDLFADSGREKEKGGKSVPGAGCSVQRQGKAIAMPFSCGSQPPARLFGAPNLSRLLCTDRSSLRSGLQASRESNPT